MDENQAKNIGSELHNYTHGINSDPLTILAILFSALIHDVDHQGISNAQLAVENTSMRDKYRNKSIAEQHSLDIAWDLLMEDRFIDLRNALFSVEAEMKRFRQVCLAKLKFCDCALLLLLLKWRRHYTPGCRECGVGYRYL